MQRLQIDTDTFITLNSDQHLLTKESIASFYKQRSPFSHKGNYGHALIIAGSYGMAGAAVLTAKACLRSGAGKVSCSLPESCLDIMQISVPEAICVPSGKKHVKHISKPEQYDAIAIGPGIGKHLQYHAILHDLFLNYKKPLVIDADGLNTLADNKKFLHFIPQDCVLTPHAAEFDRLFGTCADANERISKAAAYAEKYNVYIVLKGHHTVIATPSGEMFFNTTGNAGMATAGSGDVLTGIITALIAQGYTSLQASQAGVYLHGLSGDIAAQNGSQTSLIAGDLIHSLSEAFRIFLP